MKKTKKINEKKMKPAPKINKNLKDPRLKGPGAAKRMKEKLGY